MSYILCRVKYSRHIFLLLIMCIMSFFLYSQGWIKYSSNITKSFIWKTIGAHSGLPGRQSLLPELHKDAVTESKAMSRIQMNRSQQNTKALTNVTSPVRATPKNTTKVITRSSKTSKLVMCESNFMKEYSERKNFICFRPTGGLGNNLFLYASAYGIAAYLNRTLVIDNKNIVAKYFNLTAKTVGEYQCVTQTSKKILSNLGCGFDKRMMEIPKGNNYCVGEYLQSYKYFKHVEEDIRRQFTFRKEYRDKAMRIVEQAVQTYNRRLKRRGHVQRPTLVGVHVRRGDLVNNSYGYDVATPEYLDKAMRYFRHKYKTILFIVCSNEMKWSKKHVQGDDVIYTKNTFVTDMAVLMSCDHTLSTVGTFGWWVGYLTGGNTLYYQWPAKEGTPLRSQFSKDFSDFFPSTWIGMS